MAADNSNPISSRPGQQHIALHDWHCLNRRPVDVSDCGRGGNEPQLLGNLLQRCLSVAKTTD